LSDHDFMFALEMADDPDGSRMLGALCTAVLGHVGYPAPTIAEITGELHEAITTRGANGSHRCGIRFVAAAGSLQIVVVLTGAPEWRTTRPLPHP
jgi:hypothetical protein